MTVRVRLARPADRDQLAEMRHALWPEGSTAEHARELETLLAGTAPSVLPYAILVAQTAENELIGFAETSLRSYAEGCDEQRPPGYLEGWYVAEAFRRRGVGAALLRAAEEWARGLGCTEMASDALLDNEISHRAHKSLGFDEIERLVHYRKAL